MDQFIIYFIVLVIFDNQSFVAYQLPQSSLQ